MSVTLNWWEQAGLTTYHHPMTVTPPTVEGVILFRANTPTAGVCLRHPDTGEWWWLASATGATPVRCPADHTEETTP
jgi:hypothetical protein